MQLWPGAVIKFPHLGYKESLDRCGEKQQYQKILLNLPKYFFLRINYTPFMSQSFQIWDHFFSLLFPQGLQKSEKFWHWTSKSGGKKTFKRSKQTEKKCKNLFTPWRFNTLYEQKFSNLRPLLSILSPKDFEYLKSLDIGLREVGEKRPLNGVRKCDGQT